MSLQYKFVAIPIKSPEEAEEELNRFIRSVRVITTHREFIDAGEKSFWSVVVEYVSDGEAAVQPGKKRIDYRETLSPEDFAVFAKLRDWRKVIAAEEDIPVYNVFTNDQLAKMVEKRIMTKAALKEIEGVGEARMKKYGDAVIKIIKDAFPDKGGENEKSQSPLPANHGSGKPSPGVPKSG